MKLASVRFTDKVGEAYRAQDWSRSCAKWVLRWTQTTGSYYSKPTVSNSVQLLLRLQREKVKIV